MSDLLLMLGVLVGSFIVGYFLISKVPSLLHTPLMSMTNAVSAITIIAALVLFAVETTALVKLMGAVAIIAAAFNVLGGFVITNRMLKMFKKKNKAGALDNELDAPTA